MRMKRLAPAAVASLALLGAAPAHAIVVYAYSRPDVQYVTTSPGFITGNTTLPFDSCAPATCVSASFQQPPGADRLVVAENGGGFHTTTHDFEDDAFLIPGIHRDGDAMLAVAQVTQPYKKGSVLYLLSSPRGVFSYISEGLLTGDTPNLPMSSCLPAAAGTTCGAIRFDFGELPGASDTVLFRLFPSSGPSTAFDYDFARGSFGKAGAYFAEDSFLRRLAVIPLPGGVSPPTGVPEPATWALVIAGFGAVGVLARRRRAAVL